MPKPVFDDKPERVCRITDKIDANTAGCCITVATRSLQVRSLCVYARVPVLFVSADRDSAAQPPEVTTCSDRGVKHFAY